MRKLSADYILPVTTPPIKNGVLLVDDHGIIIDILNPSSIGELSDVEKFNGVLCPGFVNTHCHLELSYMSGMIKPSGGLADFIGQVEQSKNIKNKTEIHESIEQSIQLMRKNGIVAVGDISNTNDTFQIKNNCDIYFHTFIEVYGSNPLVSLDSFNRAEKLFQEIRSNTKNNSASIIPHSSFSVSEKLFEKIKIHALKNNTILSIHHQESNEENLFFLKGEGPIAEMIQKFGTDISFLEPYGRNPLQTISSWLPKENHILFVHNTYSEKEDILFAKNYFDKCWWCFCPNANLFIESRLPVITSFPSEQMNITIGTDSLASNQMLSILEEMKTISRIYPDIRFEKLLLWATLNGSQFLKIENKFGSFEKGKSPGINLIEQVDVLNMRLKQESKVRVLI